MINDSLAYGLEQVKDDLLKMGRLLQEQIALAVKSLTDKNIELAKQVIAKDDIVDKMQLDIEKRCLELIALKQPMAKDLRMISTILRDIIDMERMSDHAEDIARACIELYEQEYIKPLIDIPRMAQIADIMLEKSLKAFINEDVELAMTLAYEEKEMDDLYHQIFRELLSYMAENATKIAQSTDLLLIAGHIERIGDHATNLGEAVIYMVEGKRVNINKYAKSC